MIELIDSHCHLDDERFKGEEEKILANAREAGFEAVVTIGTDEATGEAAHAIARRHPGFVFHTIGAHPNEADRLGETELTIIERLARETCPVAIGEIGLDYHHPVDPAKQFLLFKRMLGLAREMSLPVVVHDRDAHVDIYETLKSDARGLKVLLHCYSAGTEFVQPFLDLGCHFSFAGPLTFKNGKDHRDALALVPLDRIMVETDAPYLTPDPHRGKRNEPAYAVFTARKAAEVKGVPFEEFAVQTTRNARAFYGLKAR